jgi:hypothetical protein
MAHGEDQTRLRDNGCLYPKVATREADRWMGEQEMDVPPPKKTARLAQ